VIPRGPVTSGAMRTHAGQSCTSNSALPDPQQIK
jgi:hypothetical protein